MGLVGITPERRLASLSGGQRTRVALAALIFDQPDMILLDEPTNNLDREGRVQVARLLDDWKGGAIVVSHDRELLHHVDRIIELSTLGARIYGGGFDAYTERRAEERAAADHRLDLAERQVRQVDHRLQAARETKARKDSYGRRQRASGSQSKLILDGMKARAEKTEGRGRLMAERLKEDATRELEEARAEVERVETLRTNLPGGRAPARKVILRLDMVSAGYDRNAPVIRDVSMTIIGPERLAVAGGNGAGKTTLLRLVIGDLQPFSGEVLRPARAAMLDQQVAILDAEATILANFRRINPDADENACRAALARFLFRAEAALQRVDRLSVGERLRAGLACVLGGGTLPDLLILDEPTNHLDLESIAAIESGLNGYEGALLVVSPDQDFLQAIGVDRVIELASPPR
jgi:ATPase subunit of ABC transporter with duplicated ATPase domains